MLLSNYPDEALNMWTKVQSLATGNIGYVRHWVSGPYECVQHEKCHSSWVGVEWVNGNVSQHCKCDYIHVRVLE